MAIPVNWLGIAKSVWGFVRTNIVPILLVFALAFSHYKAYSWGAEGVREEFAEARAEQAEKEVKLREKEAQRNIQKGEEVTERVTKNDSRLGADRERADEYLRENPLDAGCYLTDDDARMLNSVGVQDRK